MKRKLTGLHLFAGFLRFKEKEQPNYALACITSCWDAGSSFHLCEILPRFTIIAHRTFLPVHHDSSPNLLSCPVHHGSSPNPSSYMVHHDNLPNLPTQFTMIAHRTFLPSRFTAVTHRTFLPTQFTTVTHRTFLSARFPTVTRRTFLPAWFTALAETSFPVHHDSLPNLPTQFIMIARRTFLPTRFTTVTRRTFLPARFTTVTRRTFHPARFTTVTRRTLFPTRFTVVAHQTFIPKRFTVVAHQTLPPSFLPTAIKWALAKRSLRDLKLTKLLRHRSCSGVVERAVDNEVFIETPESIGGVADHLAYKYQRGKAYHCAIHMVKKYGRLAPLRLLEDQIRWVKSNKKLGFALDIELTRRQHTNERLVR
uniref:Uncharacterized protein n=1 Tax=Timema douglasi TaxID=61478 RepID=A0A7R8VL64_TIMDO|nr:unnamed protein product [Timema douglasi]